MQSSLKTHVVPVNPNIMAEDPNNRDSVSGFWGQHLMRNASEAKKNLKTQTIFHQDQPMQQAIGKDVPPSDMSTYVLLSNRKSLTKQLKNLNDALHKKFGQDDANVPQVQQVPHVIETSQPVVQFPMPQQNIGVPMPIAPIQSIPPPMMPPMQQPQFLQPPNGLTPIFTPPQGLGPQYMPGPQPMMMQQPWVPGQNVMRSAQNPMIMQRGYPVSHA